MVKLIANALDANDSNSEPNYFNTTVRQCRQSAGAAVGVVTGRSNRRLASTSMKGLALIAAAALSLSACSNPVAKAGDTSLGTSLPLAPARDLSGAATPGVMIWRSPDLAEHERTASSYMIPMATVYRGRGSDFGTLSPQQVDEIAGNLTRDVRTAIARRFKVVNTPGPGVFTLQLILVRATPPHSVYIANGPYDWSSTVIGMPDAHPMSGGELIVSGKFLDSTSGHLLVGFVAPVSPQAMELDNPSDPNSAFRFISAASQEFASNLVAAIVRQRQIGEASISK